MDSIYGKLSSIGVAMYAKPVISSPEEVIIESIKSNELPDDKRVLGLIFLWLLEYSSLVHVDRLSRMISDLDSFQIAVLGAIAAKLSKNGDQRWNKIVLYAKKQTRNATFSVGDSDVFLKIKGTDKDFERFGIRMVPFHPDSEKKLLPRQVAIKQNPWLRNRALFGSNTRADVATSIELGCETGYACAKMARCSTTSGYRNFSALNEAGWPFSKRKSR